MDYFSRAVLVLVSGLFGTVLTLAPYGYAHAQDENSVSQLPDSKVLKLAGCWQGNAFNDGQNETSILFFFQQSGNKINQKHSTIDLEPTSTHGPIKGKVSRTRFRFSGKLSDGCGIFGGGSIQNDGTLTGRYTYTGNCVQMGIDSGEFSKVTFLGATCP